MHKQKVSILGATGSIGVNTLNVIRTHPGQYEIFALTAHSNMDLLFEQCCEFKPALAVTGTEEMATVLHARLKRAGINVETGFGSDALIAAASDSQVDTVMAAIVGGAGLLPTLAAAKAGKKILLANKESLVMLGELFMQTARINKATVLPIDSEHNAIFQCLPVSKHGYFEEQPAHGFSKIVLTASGGPFREFTLQQLASVTPDQACAHPNWKMGRKISVDSATLINKALELIEASYLFATPPENIDILVHPQSIVHSMVHYCDGSVLAQLGNPDMRTPIAYGLAWPERMAAGVKTLDLTQLGRLDFEAVDDSRFPGLALGRSAAQSRGAAPVIFNAVNEIAVAAFLNGKLGFTQIPVIIDQVLQGLDLPAPKQLEDVLNIDSQARKQAADRVERVMLDGNLNGMQNEKQKEKQKEKLH